MKKLLLAALVATSLHATGLSQEYHVKYLKLMDSCADHLILNPKSNCNDKVKSLKTRSPHLPKLCNIACNNRDLYYSDMRDN